jgi:hypothetical protein
VDTHIKALLDRYTPQNVSEWEQSHTYVWVSLQPFLDLAYKSGQELAPIPQDYWDMFGIPHHAFACGSQTTQALGLFCVDQLCLTQDNRKLFINEGLLGYLICLNWYIKDAKLQTQAVEVMKRFGVLSAPSLQEIASACIASYIGLSPVASFVSQLK